MPSASTTSIVGEIDALLARAGLTAQSIVEDDAFRNVADGTLRGHVVSWIAGIERLAPRGSAYVDQAQMIVEEGGWDGYRVSRLFGVLIALRSDYEAGYLHSVEELIHADLYGDFLEMAEGLQEAGYKDAAAVIAGSVLEEHLRKLAARNGVAVAVEGKPRKAATLNAELTKAAVYNKLEQNNVTAWLELRNDAAHGHYDNYDRAQVAMLLQSLRDFLIRHPG